MSRKQGRSAITPAGREGVPSGTPIQRDLFDAIAAEQVYGYPGWTKPKFFRKRSMLDNTEVPRVQRLLDAEIVAWDESWDGTDPSAKVWLEPTAAGREWRQRIADREQRAAERRAARSAL